MRVIINRKYDDEKRSPFYNVKLMIEEYFVVKNRTHEDSIVILGYNIGDGIDKYRSEYPNSKIIVYQLEQLYDNMSLWYNEKSTDPKILNRTNHIKNWLLNCDEIWDYDVNNIEFLNSLGYKDIKYRPLIHTQKIKTITNSQNPKYDVLFFGSINKRRAEFIHDVKEKYNIKVVGSTGILSEKELTDYNLSKGEIIFGDRLDDLIKDSKIILNLHYYDSKIQEQVRLFHLLINDKCVVSEKSKTNIYGNLIHEFNSKSEMVEIIDGLINTDKWKPNKHNTSDRFKSLSDSILRKIWERQ